MLLQALAPRMCSLQYFLGQKDRSHRQLGGLPLEHLCVNQSQLAEVPTELFSLRVQIYVGQLDEPLQERVACWESQVET